MIGRVVASPILPRIGGSPVGDPNEPIFQGGVDTSALYENFQAYTQVSDMDVANGGPYITLHQGDMILITNDGIDGQKSLECNYDNEADPILESNFSIGTADHFIASFWYKPSGNYHGKIWANMTLGGQHRYMLERTNSGGDYLEDTANGLLCWWNSSGGSLSADVPDFPRDGVGWYHDDPGGPNGVGALFKQNKNFLLIDSDTMFSDGLWHRLTTRFRRGTNVAGGQDIECWMDGIKIMEYLGSNGARCESGKIWGRTWSGSTTFTQQMGGPRSIPQPDPGRNRRDAVRLWVKN